MRGLSRQSLRCMRCTKHPSNDTPARLHQTLAESQHPSAPVSPWRGSCNTNAWKRWRRTSTTDNTDLAAVSTQVACKGASSHDNTLDNECRQFYWLDSLQPAADDASEQMTRVFPDYWTPTKARTSDRPFQPSMLEVLIFEGPIACNSMEELSLRERVAIFSTRDI